MGLQESVRQFRESMGFLGARFLVTIFAIEHVLQGFVYGGGTGGVVGIPIMFLLRSFGTLTASRIQVLRTIAVSPWALKPLFGIISDLVYVGGYNKLPYILLTLVSAILSCVLIVFTWPLSPSAATMLFFTLFLQIAVADLLLEAKYTDKVRDRPDVNPDLVSFVQFGCAVGQLLSIIVTGALVAVMPLKYIYLIPILPFCATLYPVYCNWLDDGEYDWRRMPRLTNLCLTKLWYNNRDDPTRTEIPIFGLNTEEMRQNWRLFLMGLIIVTISLISNAMGLLNLPIVYLFVFALISGPLMIAAFFALIDRRIAMIQSFTIIQNMCTIPLEGALFFFYTDNAAAYPAGPHFSDTFYITGIGITATVVYILSIVLYNLVMKNWNFRTVLLCNNFVFFLVSLPNIALFLRWNVAWGVPDWLFVLGTEALQVVIGTWCSIPLQIIMNQLCPPGVQATSYALLAGCSNLGASLAQYQGAFILETLGIRPMGKPGEAHQFDNLWIAAAIATCLPLLPMIAVLFLIPNASQTDSILGSVDAACATGTMETTTPSDTEEDELNVATLAEEINI